MRCKLYVITDNTYARWALKELFEMLASPGELGLKVEWPVDYYDFSQPVNMCDNKVTRYVKGALKEGFDLILIIYDMEREVTEEHVNRHLASLSSADREKVKQLPSKPCHEVWLCEVMEIKGCSSPQLCDEVTELINRHLARRRMQYEKRMFHKLLIQHTREYVERHKALPGYLARLISAVKTGCHALC